MIEQTYKNLFYYREGVSYGVLMILNTDTCLFCFGNFDLYKSTRVLTYCFDFSPEFMRRMFDDYKGELMHLLLKYDKSKFDKVTLAEMYVDVLNIIGVYKFDKTPMNYGWKEISDALHKGIVRKEPMRFEKSIDRDLFNRFNASIEIKEEKDEGGQMQIEF